VIQQLITLHSFKSHYSLNKHINTNYDITSPGQIRLQNSTEGELLDWHSSMQKWKLSSELA